MTGFVITCPECGTQYGAKADAIGPNGRTVRCARCKETWFVPAQAADRAVDPDAMALAENEQSIVDIKTDGPDLGSELTAESTAPSSGETIAAASGAHVTMRDRADDRKLARRRRTIRAIWGITLLLILTAAVLAYIFRQPLVNKMPKFASLYQAVGIDVAEGGLLIEPPATRYGDVDGQTTLFVEADIRNVSGEARPLPLIELTLHDGAGADLAQWFVESPQARLDGGETLRITTEYPDPPVTVAGLRYRFADAE